MGPVISKSSTSRCSAAARLVDDEGVVWVASVDGGGTTGLGLGFDDGAGAAAVDVRAALADCGVLVGAGADFLGGAGRVFVCWVGGGGGGGAAFLCDERGVGVWCTGGL
jgi:hypothetical protein